MRLGVDHSVHSLHDRYSAHLHLDVHQGQLLLVLHISPPLDKECEKIRTAPPTRGAFTQQIPASLLFSEDVLPFSFLLFPFSALGNGKV